jgi:hypothetical protein
MARACRPWRGRSGPRIPARALAGARQCRAKGRLGPATPLRAVALAGARQCRAKARLGPATSLRAVALAGARQCRAKARLAHTGTRACGGSWS